MSTNQSVTFSVMAIALFVLIGCVDRIEKPVVPKNDVVSSVEVSIGVQGQTKKHFVINDKDTIREALNFVRSNLNEWYRPFDTYPTPQASAHFINTSGGVEFYLWFGPNWVGGDDSIIDSIGAGLADTTEAEIEELKRILGVEGV